MYELEGKDYCESCLFELWLDANSDVLCSWEGYANFLGDPDPDYLPEVYRYEWAEFKLECRVEEA